MVVVEKKVERKKRRSLSFQDRRISCPSLSLVGNLSLSAQASVKRHPPTHSRVKMAPIPIHPSHRPQFFDSLADLCRPSTSSTTTTSSHAPPLIPYREKQRDPRDSRLLVCHDFKVHYLQENRHGKSSSLILVGRVQREGQ